MENGQLLMRRYALRLVPLPLACGSRSAPARLCRATAMSIPTADSQSRNTRLSVALVAIVAGIGILGVKYYASVVSGSVALRSDAIESVVNVIASIFTLGAVVFAEKPADREHPYGHGKIEYFSAAFEGGLIALAAAFIGWGALQSLYGQIFEGRVTIDDLGQGIIWNFVAGVANGALGLFLLYMGRRHQSRAIEADGRHVLSDFWTTLGILAGLILVKLTGLAWLDPLMALVVALLLAHTGYRLVQQSSQALLDMEDPMLVKKIIEAINTVRPKEIISLHELKTMRSGRFAHIDLHIVVPGHISAEQAHILAENFGNLVIASLGLEGELHPRINPCQKLFCNQCAVESCPDRLSPPGRPRELTLESSTAPGAL